MTHIWIFWSSKPLSALRFILFPHISSNLWIKCCFIPLWWASGHCHPWFSSRPAPKSVLHQPPSSSPASRGFVATWLWRPLHSSPTLEDLYVVEVPFHGNRDSVWFPRERNLKKKKKKRLGWCFLFSFWSDSFWYTQQVSGDFPLLFPLEDMESTCLFFCKRAYFLGSCRASVEELDFQKQPEGVGEYAWWVLWCSEFQDAFWCQPWNVCQVSYISKQGFQWTSKLLWVATLQQ